MMNANTRRASQWGSYARLCLLSTLIGIISARAEIAPIEDYHISDWAVMLSATVTESPPSIQLNWLRDPYATEYTIYRRGPSQPNWSLLGTVAAGASYTDSDVIIGTPYEYKVVGDVMASKNLLAYGYIYSGIKVPLVENRGRVILLTETSAAAQLQSELDRFEYTLIGDGWNVARANVDRTQSVPAVKQVIQSLYGQDPGNTRALILFGAIPVPYSGDISPDEHPNHTGAWPADVYYADIDGSWTDSSVNDVQAERASNQNVPGDGKFDQNTPPSRVELEVGRIDLSNLTCYANKPVPKSEIDLLRRYLQKDYDFRMGIVRPSRSAIVYDASGIYRAPEPLGARGWRALPPLVGSAISQIGSLQFLGLTSANAYTWCSVTSSGSYITCDYIASADDLAMAGAVNVVFSTFVGSYFGDWNNESNFLRAALASSGMMLTTCYAGKPQWLFHHMALGSTIGFSTRITQENGQDGPYLPHAPGTGQVHISLLGDPTLRMHQVLPVSGLQAVKTGATVTLSWSSGGTDNLVGYLVYKARDRKGPYSKVTATPITATSLDIPEARSSDFFMVRAVSLTEGASGTYFNASHGVFYPDPLTAPPAPVLQALPQTVQALEDTPVQLQLRGTGPDIESLQFKVINPPLHGTLSGVAPNLTYTPVGNYSGDDSLSFVAFDAFEESDAATIHITVAGQNDPPTVGSLSVNVGQGLTAPISLPVSDPDSPALTFRMISLPQKGTLSGAPPNLVYSSGPSATGDDVFTYVVNDGQSDSELGTVVVHIGGYNHPPEAQSVALSVPQNTPLSISLEGNDPDGDALAFAINPAPSHGSITGNPPLVTYSPYTGFSGDDSFGYSVTDAGGLSAHGVVSISITSEQKAPVARDFSTATDQGTGLLIDIASLGGTGNGTSLIVLTPPAHGVVSTTPTGVTYSPAADFHGVDSFTFALRENGLESKPARAEVNVKSVNRPPQVSSVTLNVNGDAGAVVPLSGMDPDGDNITYEISSPPTKGRVTQNAGVYTYIPLVNSESVDSFTYTATDGQLRSDSAPVTVQIHRVNHGPTAVSLSVTTHESAPIVLHLIGSDPDADPLSFKISSPPAKGDLAGSLPDLTYTPRAGTTGSDEFTFVVSDGELQSEPAKVTITNLLTQAPQISGLSLLQNGTVAFGVVGPPSRIFRTEISTDGAHWTQFGIGKCDAEGKGAFVDATRLERCKLYRVRLE